MTTSTEPTSDTILVLGATGLTGSRVARRLREQGHVVRAASRRGSTVFDWEDESTWSAALRDVAAAYLTYPVDLGLPGAARRVQALAELAVDGGTQRLVLLSGRGQHAHLPAEDAIQHSGAAWTVLRVGWFAQNFTEGFLTDLMDHTDPMDDTVLAVPAGGAATPFVDLDDVADVAVAALTRSELAGRVLELTGPRAVTFAEATAELARASTRPVRYAPVDDAEFATGLGQAGVPSDLVGVLIEVFADLRDTTTTTPTNDIELILGRSPRTLAETFARAADAVRTAGTGE